MPFGMRGVYLRGCFSSLWDELCVNQGDGCGDAVSKDYLAINDSWLAVSFLNHRRDQNDRIALHSYRSLLPCYFSVMYKQTWSKECEQIHDWV